MMRNYQRVTCAAALGASLLFAAQSAWAATLRGANEMFAKGQYEECLVIVEKAIADGSWNEGWPALKIRCEMTLGRYGDALKTLDAALNRHATSVELRWLGREVCLFNGQPKRAEELLEEIQTLAARSPWRYSDAAGRVILGKYFLSQGADARQVLELFYDRAKKDRPSWPGAWIAAGELALSKQDFAVAAESFERALKVEDGDPDIHLGLAKAAAPSDSKRAAAALAKALEINPRHVESLLFSADRLIDAEQYDEAKKVLAKALDVNPRHPLAWAYRAVLAHLAADEKAEKAARNRALAHFKNNPEVDYLIGRKLSQKYRFAEGSAYQRQALKLDPDYVPAQAQLCQDLLRLGEEEEGWRLAAQVFEQDAYNVVAHNLLSLGDHLKKFRALEQDGFLLRMDAREAEIYGEAALDLLSRAKSVLCEKYKVELEDPVIVEIFPKQEDFAIRTFGLPGGAGYLGVCFGRVITANSPASQGDSPTNWQSVLWHEFCHVVTLHKTKNKMPRWLSEGISVYEERQADASWGQWMSPQYRRMTLGGDLVPVSRLSGAFLNPPSPVHLQYAYYESSLVVEHLIDRYGLETLKRILVDLSVGMPINDALARHTGSLEALEQEFAEFAKQRAQQLAPHLDWADSPDRSLGAAAALQWANEHPHSLTSMRRRARQLIDAKQWEQAKEFIREFGLRYPNNTSADNAYQLLAEVHRELGETEQERAVLSVLTALDSDDLAAHQRLIKLCQQAEDWPAVYNAAKRLLAIHPLMSQPHEAMAEAAKRLDRVETAVRSRRALLALEPADPAQANFDLAELLYRQGNLPQAKRHTLMALEDAPRFRDAHRLLLKIVDSSP